MTVYQWLCLFGVPAVLAFIGKAIYSQAKKRAKEDEAYRLALQALLRASMVNDYNKWSERGYAPIYARENFENCWKRYHDLGINGVMDDLHNKFLQLPTDPPDRKDKDDGN